MRRREVPLIPTMIIFGLLAGRWWKSALVVGAVGWVVVLLVSDVLDISQPLIIWGAAILGLANTGVGVAIHQGVLWLVRSVRRSQLRTD